MFFGDFIHEAKITDILLGDGKPEEKSRVDYSSGMDRLDKEKVATSRIPRLQTSCVFLIWWHRRDSHNQ